MNSIAWWPSVGVLIVASVIDLCTRRVPNWLAIPFLIAGIAVRCASQGWTGAGLSLGGFGLAVLLFGIPCLLGGMGMGDLKLAAGIGAWIGPSQFFLAFIVTGMAGGLIAIGYGLWHRSLGRCFDGTAELLTHFARTPFRQHERIRLGEPGGMAIPYVPAMAIGTLFSFFAQ